MRPTSHFEDLSSVTGPFDIIGDVHGCFETLAALLDRLGYDREGRHPENRMLVFVGDVVDHGPRSGQALDLVRTLITAGRALAVKGNHEVDYALRLRRRGNGSGSLADWIDALPEQLLLDGGALLIVHGAIRADLIGGDGPEAEWFSLYGARTVEPNGHKTIPDWQAVYSGRPFVVAGHTPVARPRWSEAGGGSVIIDTGAAYGSRARDRFTGEQFQGYLTALRWPERVLISQKTEPDDLPPEPVSLRPRSSSPARRR